MGAIIGRLSFDREEVLARISARPDARCIRSGTGHATAVCRAWDRARIRAPRVATMRRPQSATSERQHIRAVAESQLTNGGELRAALEREGHRFLARNDEELIAHAYDRWGTRCFERLRGPFACAIWDDSNRRLVLARDHIGIRPLYFALLHGHGVVFASQVGALLQDPGSRATGVLTPSTRTWRSATFPRR